MSGALDKKQMTEEDIKLQYITPALTSKWNIKKITMETQITDGKIFRAEEIRYQRAAVGKRNRSGGDESGPGDVGCG